jgi:hypothetical protein
MSAGKYWLLVFLSLFITILIFIEIRCENQMASLTFSVSNNEARVTQAQQQNETLHQLLQRIAAESQRDPAFLDLLTKRGIHISVTPHPVDTPAPLPANAAPLQNTPPATSPHTP